MRWVQGIRLIIKLIAMFVLELRKGNPYAVGAVALLVMLGVAAAFVKFAKRPLGGDPERPSVSDDDFRDARNPYQNL